MIFLFIFFFSHAPTPLRRAALPAAAEHPPPRRPPRPRRRPGRHHTTLRRHLTRQGGRRVGEKVQHDKGQDRGQVDLAERGEQAPEQVEVGVDDGAGRRGSEGEREEREGRGGGGGRGAERNEEGAREAGGGWVGGRVFPSLPLSPSLFPPSPQRPRDRLGRVGEPGQDEAADDGRVVQGEEGGQPRRDDGLDGRGAGQDGRKAGGVVVVVVGRRGAAGGAGDGGGVAGGEGGGVQGAGGVGAVRGWRERGGADGREVVVERGCATTPLPPPLGGRAAPFSLAPTHPRRAASRAAPTRLDAITPAAVRAGSSWAAGGAK